MVMNLVVVSSSHLGSVFIKENLSKQEVLEYPGLSVTSGKLQGHKMTLIEPGDGNNQVEVSADMLVNDLEAMCVVSLGKAECHMDLLSAGDIVLSAESANQKLIDLALRAAEKFEPDEKACKVVVGKIVPGPLAQGKTSTRKVKEIHCVDPEGFSQARVWMEQKIPFVIVRTITPQSDEKNDLTRFHWDMAKRNFWLVKGILDAAKKRPGRKTAQS